MSLLAKLFPRRYALGAFSDLASEIWVMEPDRVEALFAELSMLADLTPTETAKRSAKLEEGDAIEAPLQVVDGVARIPIEGPIMKRVPMLLRLFGFRATSALEAQSLVSRAVNDPSVKSILLAIDSPGGTISGIQELADTIYSARDQKPIHAYASDLAASAAYWVGSQATRFTANRSAKVGSIGVYSTIVDASKAFDEAGLKVHVIRSGEHKGVGETGTPITERHLASLQKTVDRAAELFTADVARGRGLSAKQAEKLATGETWFADDAAANGLIDAVESIGSAHHTAAAAGAARFSAPIDGANDEDIMADTKPVDPAGISPDMTEILKRLDAAEKARDAADQARLEAEAKAQINAAALAEVRRSQVRTVLDTHQAAGRVTPSMRPFLEEAAEKLSIEKLDAHCAGLPVQTTAAPLGKTPTETPALQLSETDRAFAKKYRLPLEVAAMADEVATIGMDGKLYSADGTELEVK